MIDVVLDGSLLLAVPIAMLAGLVSFLSPCVLPLAPGYLAYVTGLTGADLRAAATGASVPVRERASVAAASSRAESRGQSGGIRSPGDTAETDGAAAGSTRGRVVTGALLFVLGFTVVFVSYGVLFGGLGMWLLAHQRVISVVLGVLVVVLGLGFLGVPQLAGTMLWNRERRPGYRPPRGLWGAPLLGVVFGLGWTPCIGPTLAAVQSLAFTEASAARGALLSAAYCLGLGIPFVLLAWGVRWSAGALAWTRRHSLLISRIGGSLLVAVGLMLITGIWAGVITWLQTVSPSFTAVV